MQSLWKRAAISCLFMLVFVTPARGQVTIVSVTGPEVTSSGSLGIFSFHSVAVSFTVSQPYSDVTVSAYLVGSWSGTAYLMDSIGPETTVANELASGSFVSSTSGFQWVLQPVLQHVSLPAAGTYIVVLATTDFNPPQGILCTDVPTVVADVGASNGPFFSGTGGPVYPPASAFVPYTVSTGAFLVTGTPQLNTISVNVDIKPGSFPNSINMKSRGKIPVAILSTPAFNALTLDVTSLTFGKTGNEQSVAFCNAGGEDVNGDGLLDLVCHFNTPMTGFQLGDTGGTVNGTTVDNIAIKGTDSVRIVH